MQAARLSAGRILKESGEKSMLQRMVYSLPSGSVYIVPLAAGQSDVAAAGVEDVEDATI